MILQVVIVICLTVLAAQHRYQVYSGLGLEERVKALEAKRSDSFDPKAFAELQNKVEALRIAKGMR